MSNNTVNNTPKLLTAEEMFHDVINGMISQTQFEEWVENKCQTCYNVGHSDGYHEGWEESKDIYNKIHYY